MSIKEFVERLGNAITEIENDREANAVKIVLDSLALVKRRVINSGKDHQGKQFGQYSKAVVPFFFYYGKETNRNNKTAVQELYEKNGFFASYYDWRVVNNLQVDFINFSFTNRMWSSLTPVVTVKNKNKTVIGVQAKTAKEEAKLQFQNARFGDILELGVNERNMVKVANDNRILNAFKNNGLL